MKGYGKVLATGLLAWVLSGCSTHKPVSSRDTGSPTPPARASASGRGASPAPSAGAKGLRGPSLMQLPDKTEFIEECERRAAAAKTPGEKVAAREWCNANRPQTPDVIPFEVSSNPRRGFKEAMGWWPFRPYLAAKAPARPGYQMLFYTWTSNEKGLDSDPRTDRGTVMQFHIAPGSDPTKDDLWTLIDHGAFSVEVSYVKPGGQAASNLGARQQVVVRGRIASVFANYVSEGNPHNYLFLLWRDPLPEGGSLLWRVAASSTVATVEELVRFTESLNDYNEIL